MSRSVGRAIGSDVHRDFCEVAICEAGQERDPRVLMRRLQGKPPVSDLFGVKGASGSCFVAKEQSWREHSSGCQNWRNPR